MSDSLALLEAALERILSKNTQRVSAGRKFSARAVEEEADLGNGSSYYYEDLIKKIRELKTLKHDNQKGNLDLKPTKDKLALERRIKDKYKQKCKELQDLNSKIAANHHQLNNEIRHAYAIINELETYNSRLREEIAALRRDKIIEIKK